MDYPLSISAKLFRHHPFQFLLVIMLAVVGEGHSASTPTPPGLQIASFTCDVTPPLGHPLCGGWIKPLSSVEDPLLAKGIILADGDARYVICVLDWCLLQTGSYDLLRRHLAQAAVTSESRVSLHTVHQHNAPIADANAQLLLNEVPGAPPHLDLEFMTNVAERLSAAVKNASSQLQPFSHIAYGKAKVAQFASHRRVRLANGKIVSRSSFTTNNPVLQAAVEGLIDPWLRTVTFFNGDKPLVRLHYYASHPQSFYGDGRATSDTVGLARERLQRDECIPQIYFTGCGGNVTAGKYNDGSPGSRAALAERIYAAMQKSIANSQKGPVSHVQWRTSKVRFAARTEPEFSDQTSRKTMALTNASAAARIKAALNLAWSQRLRKNPTVELNSLTLGPVTVLHLPGETFVEYQLYAESLRPNDFVAVAAYGESGPGYICMDQALTEGGYEPTLSRVGPPTEFLLKEGIAALLGPLPQNAPPPFTDKLHLLCWQDSNGREHPVTDSSDWKKRRAQILSAMQRVMGPLPRESRKSPPKWEVLEKTQESAFTRWKITFALGPNDRIPAWLFVPSNLKGKAPAMLCLHQTTPLGKGEPAGLGNRDLAYAKELAERGYVTLAPDYPNFGDYKIDVYQQGYASATMKGIWNHLRGFDLLASLPEVYASRIGVIGHSLGGHNAMFAAAFEPRIAAVVTSCGFNSFFKYYDGNLAGWSHPGYMPRIATEFEKDPKLMPFDFTEVLAVLAPRPVFIHAPTEDKNFEVSGVHDCIIAAAPVYKLLKADGKITAVHPEAGHDFPSDMRMAAYDWLDSILKSTNKFVNKRLRVYK